MKKYVALFDEKEVPFEIEENGDQLNVSSDGKKWALDVHRAGPHHYSVIQDGNSHDIRFFHGTGETTAFLNGELLTFQLEDPQSVRKSKAVADKIHGPAEIKAMMPGKIIKVLIKKGDKVEKGQGLLVVEAMKMENEMASPKEGTVTQLKAVEGQSVESGALLAVIE
ncbi:MAG: biotin/lipoyl-containing protein [Deltaproteobacteria bacterium]|nr:biotin/lipoyl-containing protein [Deltaproteobacteria bacterium]